MQAANKFPRILSLATLLFAVGCAILPTPEEAVTQNGGPAASDLPAGDAEALRALAIRLLSPPYPGAPPPEATRLLVGQLPDDLPFELPLPEGAVVVGSLLRGGHMDTEIVLDVNQPPQAVVDFYLKELEAQGFARPGPIPESGFLPAVSEGLALCHSGDELFLHLSAFGIENKPTDVRVSLQVGQPYTPCLMLGSGPGQGLIPALTAPPDSVLHTSGGGGGSDDSAYTTADMKTVLTPSELAAHYQPQLETAGWQRIQQSQSEYVAWSAWRLTDDSGKVWAGSLIVTKSPASAEDRFLLLRVDRLRQN